MKLIKTGSRPYSVPRPIVCLPLLWILLKLNLEAPEIAENLGQIAHKDHQIGNETSAMSDNWNSNL